ncbi:MAG TPA: LuxR C-terminal-related transcriptional regulator [Candidatus Limnocylindrales bacterium]|nr:LuxR C-terminal-related transcriptional regulator [Candidatus Limnocylindrales bacterium]
MPASMSSARFIGRDAAFARLAPSLEEAADGDATTVLVHGAGGIGVSRFLDEAASRLRGIDRPFVVLTGRSYRAGVDEPYGAILRALRPAFRAAPDDELARLLGPATEDVVRLLPDLQARLAPLGVLPLRPTVTSAERRQGRVLEGILGVVGRLAERQPVLLVLEDLHEADAATRALVAFLARIKRHQRVCLVATYQTDELNREHPLTATLDEMTRAAGRTPTRIGLPPLNRTELAQLVQAIEGERPSASALVLVADRSGGIPLVAEELLAARRELSDTSLTGSFDTLVIARLGRRSTESRRVLRLLALAGRPLSRAELAGVAAAFELAADQLPPRSTSLPRRGDGTLDADLSAGLDEAIEAGILIAEDEGISFRHEHIRRAAAADLLPRLRYRHDLALAAGLVAHPTAAARHWIDAHVADRAFAAAVDAAGRAEAIHAPEDALAELELALSLVEPALGAPPIVDSAATREADADPEAGAAASAARTRQRLRAAEVATPLQLRAAEAAYATGRPARAVAYVESVLGGFDERRDRIPIGLLHERLGRYRRAAGDRAGSLAAFERAVQLIPEEPTLERATVLAALAQAHMLDGTFADAERLAREAIRIAADLGPAGEDVVVHATTTLGVSLGWGDDPEAGVALLQEARGLAEEAGDHDELFRVYANLTTVLDLVGRRGEAVEIAYAGIEASRRAGLEAVYGNFLRGNASDSLYLLGRWAESSAMSATAHEWSPAGVAFARAVDSLAMVEIETRAGEAASRRLGEMLLELETVSDAQHAVPVYRAAASFALWQGDHPDATRAAGRGWELVRDTGDWSLIAKMAATVAEVDSAAAADAGARRDLAGLAAIRTRSAGVVAAARKAVSGSGVRPTNGSRREADAYLALAAAHRDRLEGRDDPNAWDRLAKAWAEQANPYEVAKARWRQAEAILGSGEGRPARLRARPALEEAARIALGLSARPLLREVRELAGRAMIPLPADVDGLIGEIDGSLAGVMAVPAGGNGHDTNGHAPDGPDSEPEARPNLVPTGPGAKEASSLMRGVVGEAPIARVDTFGLSRREREVLSLIAEGRTNREIGERLFISQKTVGVHVGNILAKLRVSGRVEAAAVSIRLGLADAAATGSGRGR